MVFLLGHPAMPSFFNILTGGTLMTPTPITSADAICLDRHAVIEASAGTGKTYTIKSLVVRLIATGQVALGELLLVTFTEKATGELRARIRQALVDESCSARPPEERERLARAARHFDEANIHTIHGFCQRILRQYPFECGTGEATDIVDDVHLFKRLLPEVERDVWTARFGEALPGLLKAANFNDEWELQAAAQAQRWNPAAGDWLRPAPDALPDPALWTERSRACAQTIRTALGALLDEAHPEASPFLDQYAALNINARSIKTRIEKFLVPVCRFAARDPESISWEDGASLYDVISQVSGFKEHGLHVLDAGWNSKSKPGKADSLADGCPGCVAVIDALQQLEGMDIAGRLLDVVTVDALHRAAAQRKEQQGIMSFNDLLTRLDAALDPEHNASAELLCQCLRTRYRYALVDEFQDTDAVQWRILSRIFVNSPGHRLFLIGDPKQAIYGFRGADVATYLRAKQELLTEHGGELYSLGVNFRSLPSLLTSMNALFSAGWFPDKGEASIQYDPVLSPDEEPAFGSHMRKTRLLADDSARAEVVFFHAPDAGSGGTQRAAMGRAIADEIARLLGDEGGRALLEVEDEAAGRRCLRASDMAILVRTPKETGALERHLRARGIPFTFYKKTGIWQSDEALHILTLLDALIRPHDASGWLCAFATPFFSLDPAMLSLWKEAPASHPYRQQIEQWSRLAQTGAWGTLFRACLEATGLLLSENTAERERRMTNYRQIFEELAVQAYRTNAGAADLVRLLRDRRRERVELDSEANLHRIESESPKVQIMTMHASKGLEFPVVFLFGGFTAPRSHACTIWHAPHPQTKVPGRVFAYDASEEELQLAREESMDENRRLLYVALTRAKHKLYLPLVSNTSCPLRDIVHASAMQAASHGFDVEARTVTLDAFGQMVTAPTAPACELDETDKADMPLVADGTSVSCGAALDESGLSELATLADELPEEVRFHHRGRRLVSFSSLQARHLFDHDTSREDSVAFAPESLLREDDEGGVVDSPLGEAPSGAPVTPLAGPLFGTVMHALFETVSYERVAAQDDFSTWEAGEHVALLELMRRYGLAEELPPPVRSSAAVEMARLLWTTLRKPLCLMGQKTVRLCDIPACDRRHEVDFLFPFEPWCAASRTTFLNGSIDFLFRVPDAEGTMRYFFADWKTNLLSSYDAASMLAEMEQGHHYAEQYRIYALAVMRWLADRLPGEDPAAHFGGILYFFIRGMRLDSGQDGVFTHRPKDDELRELFASQLAACLPEEGNE